MTIVMRLTHEDTDEAEVAAELAEISSEAVRGRMQGPVEEMLRLLPGLQVVSPHEASLHCPSTTPVSSSLQFEMELRGRSQITSAAITRQGKSEC